MNLEQKRQQYISSLEQLLTISSILAGFSFSGLIALPSVSQSLFGKIVTLLDGDFDTAFYVSFFALFFATISLLSTIVIVMVYKIHNYTIIFTKLRRIHIIANLVFSFATASLMIAVIVFAVPTFLGIIIALITGIGVSGSFLWENMLPSMRRKRERELREEQEGLQEVKKEPELQ